jgi:molybdopterin-guanine dinucleotide biosynthesis protein A
MELFEHIAGVVLAGGRSSRMGGCDKSLKPLAGKPLLAHAIERLKPQVADLVINANGEPSRFASFGLPVIADSMPDHAGPLAGVHAGFLWLKQNRPDASYLVTVAGDTPFLPLDLVQRFLAALLPQPALVVARSDEGTHPVFGLWPVAMAPGLEKALKQGIRKVGAWAKQQGAVEVYFPKVEVNGRLVDPFFNINRPEDLAEAEVLLSPQRMEALKD